MHYLIEPPPESVARALASWQWIGIKGYQPVAITAFADVFFAAGDGIWFLDTLVGTFERTHDNKEGLMNALMTEEGQDKYCLGPFVDRAIREGVLLKPDQCYDFTLHPAVGGPIKYENILARNFVIALNFRGQMHDQVRHHPPGFEITGFVVRHEPARKPWWKAW